MQTNRQENLFFASYGLKDLNIVLRIFPHFIYLAPSVPYRNRVKQEGNSNLDCVLRTAVVAMSDGGQSAHAWRGGGVECQNSLQLDYISRCKSSVLPFDNR